MALRRLSATSVDMGSGPFKENVSVVAAEPGDQPRRAAEVLCWCRGTVTPLLPPSSSGVPKYLFLSHARL